MHKKDKDVQRKPIKFDRCRNCGGICPSDIILHDPFMTFNEKHSYCSIRCLLIGMKKFLNINVKELTNSIEELE